MTLHFFLSLQRSPRTDKSFAGTYAASKRSIEIVAETLRLELAPLGVDVLCLVTGAVKSMGLTHFGDFKLPEGSLYQSIEGVITSRAQGNDGLPQNGYDGVCNRGRGCDHETHDRTILVRQQCGTCKDGYNSNCSATIRNGESDFLSKIQTLIHRRMLLLSRVLGWMR